MYKVKGLIKKSILSIGCVVMVSSLIFILINLNKSSSKCNYCDQLAKQFDQKNIIR